MKMATTLKSKPSEESNATRSTRIDLNKSRRVAQDAMDGLRERRVKYGRISINRGNRDEPIRADKRGR